MSEIVYFFGVRPGEKAGHYPSRPGYASAYGSPMTPWGFEGSHGRGIIGETQALVAAGLARERHGSMIDHGGQPEGVPGFAHQDGWTLMALWDRSADTRGGCCALFAVNQHLDAAAAHSYFRTQFPEVFERIETHLGHPIQSSRDYLVEILTEFKSKLAEYRGRYGRDVVRKHPQGKLLDALDAGRNDLHPDDWPLVRTDSENRFNDGYKAGLSEAETAIRTLVSEAGDAGN